MALGYLDIPVRGRASRAEVTLTRAAHIIYSRQVSLQQFLRSPL